MLLRQSLQRMPGYAFQQIRSLEALPADLHAISALVLHFHHKQISPLALDRLSAFTANGGGILAIHAATASFKQSNAYFDILGGRFSGHAAVAPFQLQRRSDAIFGDVADFTVRDELYQHTLKPGIQVHFSANQAGQEIPVVWTSIYGKGRVCYACPGHLSATMRHPEYQKLLQRGLAWVCTHDPSGAIGAQCG
jgi:type 1 glutamine amidotransferase